MEILKVYGRIIKILLSVSVLSLVFSSLIPLLFQSLNQFSINKSYVFLFCNGLMVFIAKNSSLPSDHSSSSQFNDLDVAASSQQVVHFQELDDMVAADSPEKQQEEEEEEEEEEKRMIIADSQEEEEEVAETEEEEEEEKRMIVAESQEEEETEGGNDVVRMAEEEEEEEVEELNKKCEDFIRKMKKAFCSEPSHHDDYSDYIYDHHQAATVTVR